jgi:hypothetical protein
MTHKACPSCQAGFLVAQGSIPEAIPMLYEHRCSVCGLITHERERYDAPPPEPDLAPSPPAPTETAQALALLRSIAADIAAIRAALLPEAP